jgi:DNA phosphorothioation-associated putative methyltransferase
MRNDVKAFFGSYSTACREADDLLFSVGSQDKRERAIATSPIGKLMPYALYVHKAALERLDPVLRLYEGCANNYVGRVEGANVIKFHRAEPKISYLSYPNFDDAPHPELHSSLSAHLQTFRVKVRDYDKQANRPILHRKEDLVAPDYPGREKFALLTRIEVSKGLYADTSRIGLRDQWAALLTEKGLGLRGHRLVSRTT